MKIASHLILLGFAIAGMSVITAEKMDISKLDLTKLPPVADKKGVTYAKDIRPILEESCFRCHGEERQKGDLRLDSLQAVLKGGEDGKVVLPGDSKKSFLVAAVAQLNDEIAMPPKRGPGGPGGQGGPGGPGGPSGPANRPPHGPDGGNPPAGGPGAERGPGGPGRPGGFAGGGFGPPAKPLTAEQVGLIRAWIDQGAK
jgi:hypothetical protein